MYINCFLVVFVSQFLNLPEVPFVWWHVLPLKNRWRYVCTYINIHIYYIYIDTYIYLDICTSACQMSKSQKVKKHSGKMQTYGSLETEPCFHLVLCCVGKTISFLQIQVVKKRTPSSWPSADELHHSQPFLTPWFKVTAWHIRVYILKRGRAFIPGGRYQKNNYKSIRLNFGNP